MVRGVTSGSFRAPRDPLAPTQKSPSLSWRREKKRKRQSGDRTFPGERGSPLYKEAFWNAVLLPLMACLPHVSSCFLVFQPGQEMLQREPRAAVSCTGCFPPAQLVLGL